MTEECKTCEGSPCEVCKGKGWVIVSGEFAGEFFDKLLRKCPACGGTGVAT